MIIFAGIYQLITSPSGIFSLLCLMVLTGLSIYLHDSMVVAWAAFFGLIPAALGYYEHKEQMQQNISPPPPPPRGQL